MKTFKSFTEESKRDCPDGYKWSSKYKACVPKGSRWKNVGVRWGGHGNDISGEKKNGNGNGSHNGNGNGHGNGGNGNGGGGNGGGGNGG